MVHDQLVYSPTRGANVLDLLLTNSPTAVSNVEVSDNLPLTDHDAVLYVFPPQQKSVKWMLYNYKNADFDAFRDTLGVTPWDLSESDDIDTWWINGKTYFLEL